MALQATGGFGINSVFWLRSLHDSELGSTRRVLEDIEPFFASMRLPFDLRDVKTPAHLYRALDSLVASHVKPILQLDMHGTRDGGSLAATRSRPGQKLSQDCALSTSPAAGTSAW
jgi:hypothetical protein